MILTCPECASRYFVDDSKVGSAGRVVRCASCGHRWTARNEEAVDLFETPEASALGGQAEGANRALKPPRRAPLALRPRSRRSARCRARSFPRSSGLAPTPSAVCERPPPRASSGRAWPPPWR
ncbi:zinc-ribbon domain-containing protein [Caulobacter sp. RL271]|uniref:Zinc-ribbon domain-containing protein n=1 Tax=Caulobacter segnis TaxID=88688 RepID=A0ABY4ZNE2_9CAUL|nr:MJ0042-type zinc finger domain-containing protein [Caulobacter segnis]USQ94322.1 zinc-ribbon domain-containing protein [Caulobacter segnis]